MSFDAAILDRDAPECLAAVRLRETALLQSART